MWWLGWWWRTGEPKLQEGSERLLSRHGRARSEEQQAAEHCRVDAPDRRVGSGCAAAASPTALVVR